MQKGKEGILKGMEEKKKRQKKVEVVGQQKNPAWGGKFAASPPKI